jgi:hypothetical protein
MPDDDNPGDDSPLSRPPSLLVGQGKAAAPAESDPGPVAPVAGIGLTTAVPWLASLLGDRPLSLAEEGALLARLAAERFRQVGDDKKADALLKAIAPKRGRGRPRESTDDELFDLVFEIEELLRSKPWLTGTSAIDAIAKRSRWRRRGWAPRKLRDHFTRYANRADLNLEEAIDKIRGASRSAD